jgi:ABC-type uncharacterized transport system permease subunit
LFRIGLVLLATGAIALGLGAKRPASMDLPIRSGWHVTIFWPNVVGLSSLAAGAIVLVVVLAFRLRRSAQ